MTICVGKMSALEKSRTGISLSGGVRDTVVSENDMTELQEHKRGHKDYATSILLGR